MNNKNYHIGERNNYFFGKLMTVRDFENEQTYFNCKRRLGNRLLNGAGIACGLNVILVDNKTFLIEPGVAYDYLGREIVVPEQLTKKLSTIKGFEENKDKHVLFLGIRYKESLKETTFSVAEAGKSGGVGEEFNRISEGYELFLTGDEPNENDLKIDSLFKKHYKIFDSDGLKISLQVQKYASPQNTISLKVFFEKQNVSEPVSFSFDVGGEFFNNVKTDSNSVTIDYQETEISTNKKFEKEYALFCNVSSETETELLINKEKFKLLRGNDELVLEDNIRIPISVKEAPVERILIDEFYGTHLDDIIGNCDNKYIYLAKFNLVANKLAYFAENFVKHPFKQYVFSNQLLKLLSEIEEGNSEVTEKHIEEKKNEEILPPPTVKELSVVQGNNITTGVERINLGFNPKVGKVFYSYEIVHGLGDGNVCIITAIDNKANYLTDDKGLLVFGDKGIFSNEEIQISSPNFQIAAVANSEKGTLRIGVRLLEKTNAQAVDVRWWALKPVEIQKETDNLVIDDDVKVIVTPNTTRVKPLEKVRFEARIEGTENQEIRWSMAENNTGSIDNNGLYTAPAKEGVYEIRAYSVKFEGKYESAYVVVSSEE